MDESPDAQALEALRRDYRRLVEGLEANQQQFRRLARAVYRVQEDERRRLARELHDGLGQNLTALKHQLALLGTGAPPLPDALRERLATCLSLCEDTLAETRQLSRLLRPQVLDDLGLAAALRWLARTLGEASGLPVEVRAEDLPEPDGDTGTLLFRVAQEALSNCARHAGARRAGISLGRGATGLRLEVWDDGRGFDLAQAFAAGSEGRSAGLPGMRERVALFGGRLAIDSAPGAGTRVVVLMPAAGDAGTIAG